MTTHPAEHQLSIHRKQIGNTPIRPSRPVYGTTGRCSCGDWKIQSNEAPSKGGTRQVKRLFDEHLKGVSS